MLAILATGLAAARTAINGARAAGHERDRMLALHGAMAALADAEHDIEGGADPGSARAAALAGATPAAFAAGCGGGAPYDGLCEGAVDAGDIFAALADADGPAVALGTFTGARMPAGAGGQAPRYLIERMPAAGGSLLYRVSALGFGSAATTQVAIQAYYRKLPAASAPAQALPDAAQAGPPPLPGTPGGPGLRVGWREIGNWQETLAARSEAQ
ncbi:hypothetical protein IM543_08885 [Massilia sp. UMI-21]|nr:hypothetical protein IM543_08885 [Massilia sp. UMI-21]